MANEHVRIYKFAQSHKLKIDLGAERATECTERERSWAPRQIHNPQNFKFNQALIHF